MIVQAKKNKQDDVPLVIRKYAFESDEAGNLPLTLGKRYVVAGVRNTPVHKFFLIVSDAGYTQHSPWWYPSELFDVIDDSVPSDWQKGGDLDDLFFTFPELSEDRTVGGLLQSDLEDGEPYAIKIFRHYYDKYSKM